MNRLLHRLLPAALLLFASVSLSATVVTGRVSCEGEPLAGVSVSDGENVVLTDAQGCYTIKSKLELGYVFISVPSGYEVPSDGVLPVFFKRLSASLSKASADFSLKKVDQSKCNLIVYNDIHLVGDQKEKDLEQAHEGFFPDVLAEYEKLKDVPVYGLTVGDMTSDNKWYTHNFGLPEYLKEVSVLPFQIYHCMGNHDNDLRGGGGDFNSSKTYREVIGPNYYSINIGAYHIVFLDNIFYDQPADENGWVSAKGYHTHLDGVQLRWLRNDLKNVAPDTPILLVAHAPFSRLEGVDKGEDRFRDGFNDGYYGADVLNMFRKFGSVHLLTAHTHENYFVQINSRVLEHNNIGVSAASWKTKQYCGLNIIRDGVPGGYSVYTIDGRDLSWYYKAVGFKADECQFRSYDVNVIPEELREGAPDNTIWVNVFNYDPAWTVSLKEDGKDLDVQRAFIRDPLYRLGIDHTKLGKGAFKSMPNNHMFTARASRPDSSIEITVTDRFGKVYKQTLERPAHFGLDMFLGNK